MAENIILNIRYKLCLIIKIHLEYDIILIKYNNIINMYIIDSE